MQINTKENKKWSEICNHDHPIFSTSKSIFTGTENRINTNIYNRFCYTVYRIDILLHSTYMLHVSIFHSNRETVYSFLVRQYLYARSQCLSEATVPIQSPSAVGKFCLHTDYCAIFITVVRCAMCVSMSVRSKQIHFIIREKRAQYQQRGTTYTYVCQYIVRVKISISFFRLINLRFSRSLSHIVPLCHSNIKNTMHSFFEIERILNAIILPK